MSASTRPDAASAPPPSFWAGPVILTDDGPGNGAAADAVPVLVLWVQITDGTSGSPAAAPGPPKLPELLERGFARLVEPAVAAVRALPRLDGAEVRLSTDGARFQLIDGPDPLVSGELSAVSAEWRDPVREADQLTLLVATEPQANPGPNPGPDQGNDPAMWAMEQLAAACAAGTLVGAHLTVRVDDSEPTQP